MKDLSYEELLEQEISRLEQDVTRLEQEVREAREEKTKQKIARLERKEKNEQKIARLEQLISKKDDDFDKEQWKRVKRTFFAIFGVIFLILLYLALENGINISDINIRAIVNIFSSLVALTFAVAFMSGFIMFVSYGVWFYIINGAIRRAETIAELKGELYAIKSSKYDEE